MDELAQAVLSSPRWARMWTTKWWSMERQGGQERRMWDQQGQPSFATAGEWHVRWISVEMGQVAVPKRRVYIVWYFLWIFSFLKVFLWLLMASGFWLLVAFGFWILVASLFKRMSHVSSSVSSYIHPSYPLPFHLFHCPNKTIFQVSL